MLGKFVYVFEIILDGNCFFWVILFVIIGLQDYYYEIRKKNM